MASADADKEIDGVDRIQQKVATLSQGGDHQYIIAALTPEILKKPEYSATSVAGRSDRIITVNSDVHPYNFTTFFKSQGTSKLRGVFNTFNNAQLTALTPMIKFFLRGDQTKEIIPIPLQNMHNYLNPRAKAMESVNKRYSYLGIKQIDIDLSGDHPETSKSDIQSTVTFYGNNLSLFEKDGQGEDYLPLIVPYYTRKNSKKQAGNHYQLLMQVGWNIPSSGTKKSLKFTEKQMEAITAQSATYIMRYYSHGFSFNEDGSFQLKVDYISALDEVMKDINIMEPTEEEVKKIVDLKMTSAPSSKDFSPRVESAINDFIKTYIPSSSSESKKKIVDFFKSKSEKSALKEVEKLENAFSQRNSDKLKNLVRSLLKNKAGFKIELSPSYVHHLYLDIVGANYMDDFFAQEGISGGQRQAWVDNARANLSTVSQEEAGRDFDISQISTQQTRMSSETVMSTEKDFFGSYVPGEMVGVYNFFKFGDIITAFIVSCNGEKYLKENDMKIILGNIRFVPKEKTLRGKKAEAITASLYDIPIALDSLKKIIYEEYVNTTRKRLSLKNFMSSLLFKVVQPYYMEKDIVMDHRPVKGAIRTGQIVVPKSLSSKIKDNIKESELKNINLRSTRISVEKATGDEKKMTLFYYVNISSPSPPITDDMLNTFDHYHIGSAQSIVKKVSFTQANSATQKARADDNVVASLRNEDSVIIPQVYNVSLDLIGNINFYPGYSFHLHPTLLGLSQDTKDSVLKTLGLTGTYMTIRASHSFSSDGFTTSLEAYNVYVDRKIKQAADAQDVQREA